MDADWYVYVLECADDTLYTGITTEPERRLREHNDSSAGAAYTRSRRPVEMRTLWPCADQSEAASAEAAFKKLTRDEKLERLEVGLSLEELEPLADEYLRVFELGDASPADVRPLKLIDAEDETIRRARRYREIVLDELERLRECRLGSDVAERVTPRFVVGPGHVDGHGFRVDGEPVVCFDMRLADHHFEEEGFLPDVHALHELIHAIHYDLAPAFYPGRDKSPAEQIWHRLVAEGLAQRWSQILTGRDHRAALWFGLLDGETYDDWFSHAKEAKSTLVEAIEADRSIRLDDERWDDLFRGGSGEVETMRLGYWWAWRIADRAEYEREPEDLLAMSPDEWWPYVEEVLGV